MSENEFPEPATQIPQEEAAVSPDTGDDSLSPSPNLARRTFLKAAAISAAVTGALFTDQDQAGHLQFGGLPAWANDLSDYPCTAQDIDVGMGIIINEPCADADCSNGSFCALVRFPVYNSTSTGRYCISLHLSATTFNGMVIAAQDVLLKTDYRKAAGSCVPVLDTNNCPVLAGTSTAAGKTQGESAHLTYMYGVIRNFPCSATEVCFGKKVPDTFTGKCTAAGLAPCSTIAFSTSTGDAGCTTPDQKPPRGQCRHRQICVRGFGVSVACADSTCAAVGTPGTDIACTVDCGKALKIAVSASGGTVGFGAGCNPIPCTTAPTLKITGPGLPPEGIAPSAPGCFTVASPQQGLYTVTATDCHGCSRQAFVHVSVNAIKAGLTAGTPGCNGQIPFTASTTGTGTCTYQFLVDGTEVQAASSKNTFIYDPCALGKLDNQCHQVLVKVVCSGCTATAERKVKQCVGTHVSTATDPATCPANVACT